MITGVKNGLKEEETEIEAENIMERKIIRKKKNQFLLFIVKI